MLTPEELLKHKDVEQTIERLLHDADMEQVSIDFVFKDDINIGKGIFIRMKPHINAKELAKALPFGNISSDTVDVINNRVCLGLLNITDDKSIIYEGGLMDELGFVKYLKDVVLKEVGRIYASDRERFDKKKSIWY